MPEIKELKVRAKSALEENYWKSVFVCIILIVLSLGTVYASLQESITHLPEILQDISANLESSNQKLNMQAVAVVITLIGGVLIVSIIGKLLVGILIENPVNIGASMFMVKTLNKPGGGQVADITYAFDNDYLRNVKAMFRRSVMIFLWFLVLVVPGVIRMYEYRLVPYLAKDMPNASPKELLAYSRDYMMGHKKEALMLDISYIGWYLLGILTLGILEVLYVKPYKALADAAFYQSVKEIKENNAV